MILVILGICVLLFAAGIIYECFADDSEFIFPFCCGVGAVGFVISVIAVIALTISVSNLRVIDEQIEMYEQENQKIENQIAEAVRQYQEYESEILVEVAPESAVTLVALYPDLKSDTLVQKQIEVYISNNEKTKELKEQKIKGNVKRWWLYFGGVDNG
ncbi:MAG: hypothetical protein IKK85_03460 [Clostridia bacterium]|nr:hypothetical protein [Clostridia bacterium]